MILDDDIEDSPQIKREVDLAPSASSSNVDPQKQNSAEPLKERTEKIDE